MQAVLEAIFSLCGGYNFLNGQVCREFRDMVAKKDGVDYLNELLHDGRECNFTPSEQLMQVAFDRSLFSLLEACEDYIPENICDIAAKKGNLEVLQWARSKG
ncbi:Hypothetical protein BQ3484_414 [Cedratvirus A11]|uniref:Ankyrin repeat-containing domain n=1 Tax=Cedratvirus A11 TaxID=1903266 RepID=A0A1M7XUX7_9VIRU|nr:Hypothetical protein BQ3484_414 [Cedratvirus A11]SHO33482.1 Hypothetical protein BQ3484_414 [Cedratvirus A11]